MNQVTVAIGAPLANKDTTSSLRSLTTFKSFNLFIQVTISTLTTDHTAVDHLRLFFLSHKPNMNFHVYEWKQTPLVQTTEDSDHTNKSAPSSNCAESTKASRPLFRFIINNGVNRLMQQQQ